MSIEGVVLGEGHSVQLMATTDTNSTLVFTKVVVTDEQDEHVTLNSSGYLTIGPDADTTFFIDVRTILEK